MKKIVNAYLWILILECTMAGGVFAQTPTITNVSPNTGTIGSPVIISGTNFSSTPSNNTVYFGAVAAAVTSASSSTLHVNVPVGATYAPVSVTTGGLTAAATAPFLVTYYSTNLLDSSAFAPKVDFPASTGYNVAIGDVDGDGKPDLIVTNQVDNTVSVYRNTSTVGSITGSSFDSPVTFAVKNNPIGVAFGDLDGDGKPDLAVTNYNFETVSVLRNTSSSGSISFDPEVDFATGIGPYNVEISDLNADGKPELVVANDFSGTVSVFQNLSSPGSITSGSFAPGQEFTTGSSPYCTLADIDGDGKIDIISSNYSSNTISVLLNTNTGGAIDNTSFAAKVDFPALISPFSAFTGDLDGDGKLDIIVANENDWSISVFRNLSTSGTVSLDTKINFTGGSGTRYAAIHDLDGDGKPDIASSNRVDNTVSVLKNNSTSGSISFASAVNFETANFPRDVVIGDLDGDNKPELVTVNEGTPFSSTVSVFHNIIAIPPIVSLTSTSIGFGDQRVGTTSAPASVTLKNTGGLPLQIDSITISDNFNQTNNLPISPATLAPSDTGTMSVTFTPSSLGIKNDSMRIYDNAAGSPHIIALNGRGVLPSFSSNPSALSFVNVVVDNDKLDSIDVTNTGTGPLNITSVLSNNSKFTVSPGSATIAPSANRKFYITFHPTSLIPTSGKIIFTHDALSSSDSLTVSGTASTSISILKLRDSDGDINTTGDRSAKRWRLSWYRDSVSAGTLLASADTSKLSFVISTAGIYVACEADSGIIWNRINGNLTRYDTMVVTSTVIDTFINSRTSTIIVHKYKDSDGLFGTSNDRALKTWYFEVHKDSSNGTLVGSGNGSTLVVDNLWNGTYYVVEADSTDWIHLGYVVNGSGTASAANNASVTVLNGSTSTVDFINAPPIYNQRFRSFRQDSIALDKDNFGKIGKFVKRKADKVYFKFVMNSAGITHSAASLSLTLKFSVATSGAITRGLSKTDTIMSWANLKTVITPAVIDTGLTVQIDGVGSKGKQIKTMYAWSSVPKTTTGTVLTYLVNQPKLPMPNRVNALFETFNLGGFSSASGLPIGFARIDSPKAYGWLLSPKYKDVLKTLSDKTGLHTHAATNFDNFMNGKSVLKQQKTLPPSKFNNILLADLIALRFNIVVSALGVTPVGFGELTYGDGTSNPLNGRMIKDLAILGDSMMSARNYAARYPSKSNFQTAYRYGNFDSTIQRINSAFEGTLDTITFADSLKFRGTRSLSAVSYLHANPGIEPARIIPIQAVLSETPTMYELYQNYPNPFNPTTTIQFDLAEQSVVSLKVYNVLGQEVATLLNHQEMDDGTQEVQFDASSLASGVYFYRLTTASIENQDEGLSSQQFTSVKKMLLLR